VAAGRGYFERALGAFLSLDVGVVDGRAIHFVGQADDVNIIDN
jgi:hypothetical protein